MRRVALGPVSHRVIAHPCVPPCRNITKRARPRGKFCRSTYVDNRTPIVAAQPIYGHCAGEQIRQQGSLLQRESDIRVLQHSADPEPSGVRQ